MIERSFLCHADLFAFGMALAVGRVLWEDSRLTLPRLWRPALLVVAGGSLLAIAAKATNGSEHLSYSPWNTVVALDFALLLALVVLVARSGSEAPRIARMLEWRPLVLVGVVSYSVFLWHEPLIRWLGARGLTVDGAEGLLLTLALTATLTLALSALSYAWVEAPALRLRSRTRRAGTSAAADSSAAP